jgi:hypothetical protein
MTAPSMVIRPTERQAPRRREGEFGVIAVGPQRLGIVRRSSKDMMPTECVARRLVF